ERDRQPHRRRFPPWIMPDIVTLFVKFGRVVEDIFLAIHDPRSLDDDTVAVADGYNLHTAWPLHHLTISISWQTLVIDLATIAIEAARIVVAHDRPAIDRDDDARVIVVMVTAVPIAITFIAPITSTLATTIATVIVPTVYSAVLRTAVEALAFIGGCRTHFHSTAFH